MAKNPRKLGKKWQIRWTDAHGKRRSEVHADKRDAEFALRRHRMEREEAQRGLRRLVSGDRTFDDLCRLWLETRAVGKRSGHKDESFIRLDLLPAFGGMKLSEIGAEHIEVFKAERVNRLSKKTINLQLTLFVSMMNLAVESRWIADRVKVHKYRLPVFAADYHYFRTDEERDRFLRAAESADQFAFVFYSAALFTGARAGELAGLRWDDVDFDRRLVTVQRSFAGPTKAGDVRYVPLLDALFATLRAWRLRCPTELVFPNKKGRMLEPCSRIFQETLHRTLEAAGFDRRYLKFHDMRHSFASSWMMAGGDLFKLQKILGHKSVQMTMRYAHLAPQAFAGDLGRLASVSTDEGQVVSISPKSGERVR